MARLEFPLAQGIAKGLTIAFEDRESSKDIDLSQSFHVHQVHGREIHDLVPSDLSKTSSPLSQADGLVVRSLDWFRESRKKLVIKTADCLPLIYVDPEREAIAAIHAGWRGVQQKIHLEPFVRGWLNPKTTWVWVGPSLSGVPFEVGPDVWREAFAGEVGIESYFARPSSANDEKLREKRHFDVWGWVEHQFRELGVPLVYQTDVNTALDGSFASYRRDRNTPQQGSRNLSWVGFSAP